MSEKAKNKNKKRLPARIQFSGIIWYFIMAVVMPALLLIPGATGINIPENWSMFAIIVPPPVIGFIVGWWIKFRYAKKQDDEALSLRIKGQFWGVIAFMVAFVISLLLILITLIIMETNQFLPDTLADPIVFLFSMLILAISFWIANNTKNRIYQNFMQPEESDSSRRVLQQVDSASSEDTEFEILSSSSETQTKYNRH